MRISDWSSDVCSSDLRAMQKRPLFERWIGAGSCEDFGRKHGLQGDSRHVAARIDGDRPVPVLRPARNCLQCLAPTARSAGDLGRSEEHTYELQSIMRTSSAVSCWKRKKKSTQQKT